MRCIPKYQAVSPVSPMGSQVAAETWGHLGTETCGHTMQPKACSFPVALLSPEIL